MNTKLELNDSQIHEELLNLLYTIDEFLKKNQIEYTISYGTLLGAVRHEGFIPWDDDIDLCMKRSEYNKLINILKDKNRIGKNLSAEGVCLGNSDIPFLKIINKKVEVIEIVNGGFSKDYLWIDIFPVDYVPERLQKLYFIYIYQFLRRCYYFSRYYERGWQINAKKCLLNTLIRRYAINKGSAYFAKKLNSFSEKSKKSNYIANNVWGTSGKKEVIPAKLFENFKDYKFEDITVRGVCDYDTYLKVNYGNYMKIPKKEDRISHGLRAWKNEE